MAKQLVIVESPAKAKTIGKFLGRGFAVKASMGHVRDLPKSGLGIDVDEGFATEWQEIGDRAKVLTDLRKRAAEADTIWLATDPDREGEAIAWHLAESLTEDLDGHEVALKRVVFHEITDSAVQEAFDHPGELNVSAVDAYRARRILDRLMGYKLSPLLWSKLARGLSAGRVQSVAVRLVVEREREIRAFVPDEYWRSAARFGGEQDGFDAGFVRLDGAKKELKTADDARAVLSAVAGAEVPAATPAEGGGLQLEPLTDAGPFTVTAVESKDKLDRPRPPFITSTLQQAAASRYQFAAKRTMRTAQQLYEGMEVPGEGLVGLITYMRTDSFHVANQARGAAASLIESRFGRQYLPDKPNAYKSKKGAQEAHEAIRPTDPSRTPDSLKATLKPDQWKLYDLIWRRFMSSQMAPAKYQVTTVELTANGASFEARGRVTLFDGHTRVYGRDSDDQQLPAMTEGQTLTASTVGATQHFTSPPRRYTEASLVRDLEKHGIGRPSTYASILSVIVDRGYVDHGEEAAEEEARSRMIAGDETPVAEDEGVSESEDDDEAPVDDGQRRRRSKAFHATHLGEVVTDLLLPWFGNVIDTEFTARMEAALDAIAEGEKDWQKVIADFYARFADDLGKAQEGMSPYWEKPLLVEDFPCGKVPEDGGAACTAPMAILFNRFGPYLGCSRYPDCKNTMSLTGRAKAEAELTDHTCREKNDAGVVCGRPMEKKVNRWGKPFLACTGFKDKLCSGSVSLSVNDEPLWPIETTIPCPDCETPLAVKRSKRGKFLACTRFPKCRGTLNLPSCPHTSRTGKACGKPMTEPVAGGKMACKAHPDVTAAPPKRKKDAEGEDGKKAKSTKKAAKKKSTKKASAKKTTRKQAAKKDG